jgi:hypothetical protein
MKLRPWIGQGRGPRRPPVRSYAPEVKPTTKDLASVIAALSRMRAVTRHPYL